MLNICAELTKLIEEPLPQNELAEVLENSGMSYLKTFPGMRALLSRPGLRKNLVGLLVFFRAWWKSRDYSW